MAAKNEAGLSEEAKKILKTMAGGEGPWANKQIAEQTGLESKVVSGNMTKLKKQGLVDSPVRCKYAITEDGKTALK